MKIITTEIANIREKATTASKVKEVAYKGRILESSGFKTGQAISNNGKWYELTTGGTITTAGGYTIHTFTSSGTWTPVLPTLGGSFLLNFI